METKNCRNFKEKINYVLFKGQCKARSAVLWAEKNPEWALTIGTTAIGVIGYTGKKLLKMASLNKEMKALECRHYDRRACEYYYTKRPLKTAEKLRLDREYGEGKSKGEILLKMGLLK